MLHVMQWRCLLVIVLFIQCNSFRCSGREGEGEGRRRKGGGGGVEEEEGRRKGRRKRAGRRRKREGRGGEEEEEGEEEEGEGEGRRKRKGRRRKGRGGGGGREGGRGYYSFDLYVHNVPCLVRKICKMLHSINHLLLPCVKGSIKYILLYTGPYEP